MKKRLISLLTIAALFIGLAGSALAGDKVVNKPSRPTVKHQFVIKPVPPEKLTAADPANFPKRPPNKPVR